MGISLDIDETTDELHIHNSAFKRMRNLRFLNINTKQGMSRKEDKLQLLEGFDYLPPKLRLLSWDRFPMRRMPSKFCPKYLVKLKMQGSKLEKLWEGVGVRFFYFSKVKILIVKNISLLFCIHSFNPNV